MQRNTKCRSEPLLILTKVLNFYIFIILTAQIIAKNDNTAQLPNYLKLLAKISTLFFLHFFETLLKKIEKNI